MSEKERFLKNVLRIVESEKGSRTIFYQLVLWLIGAIFFVYILLEFSILSRENAMLGIGFFVGIFIAKTSTLLKFRHLGNHLNKESLKKDLSES